jgi:hypothetical protein
MKRVISASKRTDIPAFYMKWFVERVQAGSVDVDNPLYRSHKTHVSLSADDVAWIVFWSKNYGVFQRFARHFEAYQLYFQFTINPPNALLEPDVPPTEQALRQAEWLTRRYGGSRVAWRYDPITCWREHGSERSNYDTAWFASTCAALAGCGVQRCYTSFADHYAKFRQRVRRIYPDVELVDPPEDTKREWAAKLAAIAGEHRIELHCCTEAVLESVPGITKGRCIDGGLLTELGGQTVSCAKASDTQSPGREACGCTRAIDIGNYQQQECGYACLYCYANPNHRRFASQQVRR